MRCLIAGTRLRKSYSWSRSEKRQHDFNGATTANIMAVYRGPSETTQFTNVIKFTSAKRLLSKRKIASIRITTNLPTEGFPRLVRIESNAVPFCAILSVASCEKPKRQAFPQHRTRRNREFRCNRQYMLLHIRPAFGSFTERIKLLWCDHGYDRSVLTDPWVLNAGHFPIHSHLTIRET